MNASSIVTIALTDPGERYATALGPVAPIEATSGSVNVVCGTLRASAVAT